MAGGIHRVEYREALFSLGREDRVYRPKSTSDSYYDRARIPAGSRAPLPQDSFWHRLFYKPGHKGGGLFYGGSRGKHVRDETDYSRYRKTNDRVTRTSAGRHPWGWEG